MPLYLVLFCFGDINKVIQDKKTNETVYNNLTFLLIYNSCFKIFKITKIYI